LPWSCVARSRVPSLHAASGARHVQAMTLHHSRSPVEPPASFVSRTFLQHSPAIGPACLSSNLRSRATTRLGGAVQCAIRPAPIIHASIPPLASSLVDRFLSSILVGLVERWGPRSCLSPRRLCWDCPGGFVALNIPVLNSSCQGRYYAAESNL
jgi:hypothetical protein